ncbi:glycosyltransferase [Parablautia muri]|uniref:Group 1 glycosyl transferase n=1 Tax=Parablautia muri TaxID=2320879 RepID=A0A9X5GS66_9FIRM|nr:glycosyltransferase [Parablautia muri]NBJ92665.1 group 1 glycosyl transferase [Parablautia muri]
MLSHISKKNVLFITTKNPDYIRNVQEISLIKKEADHYVVIGSKSKYYFVRLLCVYFSLITTSVSSFDTVFIGFAPQLILPLFKYKFRHTHIIADFFISLFDTFCQDRQLFHPRSLPGRFLHSIDQITLDQANLVICDTISHGKYFTKEFGIPPTKLYPLYLQADTTVYHPLTIDKPAKLKNKFMVLYFGSILPLQGIDIVLKTITLLKKEQNIFFYCIGPIKKKTKLMFCPDAANVKFIDWLSQEQLARYIGQADLCLAGHFNRNIAKARRTIPGKACIYEAMKKSMVLGDTPANHELFKADSKHIFVELGSPRALADIILQLSKSQNQGTDKPVQ